MSLRNLLLLLCAALALPACARQAPRYAAAAMPPSELDVGTYGAPVRVALPLRHPARPGDIIEVGERWL